MRFLATAIESKDNHLFASGKQIKEVKSRYVRLRKGLQARGTKSAKRKLQKVSGKENRFMTNTNHVLSKVLIQFVGDHSLITIEVLTGINLSTTVRKKYRYYRLSWAFYQLRQMVEYKGLLNNVKVIAVDQHTQVRNALNVAIQQKKTEIKKLIFFVVHHATINRMMTV